jgi:hypothetical protein
MDKKKRWLRFSYWTAAIADFVVAVSVLVPARMGVTHYVYPMGLIAATAFSWGVLLIFADRRPYERKWVLVPTILVVSLLGLVAAHAGLTGLISPDKVIPRIVIAIGVLSVLVYSYIISRDLT